jgi:hypothetical protein
MDIRATLTILLVNKKKGAITMKTQLVSAALLALAFSGCATHEPIDARDSCRAAPSKKPRIVRIVIKEDPNNEKNNEKKINRPSEACAHPGDQLAFMIQTREPKNASVKGKPGVGGKNDWIDGGTTEQRKWFFVMVPFDVLKGKEEDRFEYDISVEGLDDLDPEVRVRQR